ncbi:MAK10-like protein [Tanacetum coccineum]
MAFGGNTHDLGSFGEETDEITDLHQILEEVLLTERRDGVAGIKRRRRDPSSDGVRDLVTASGPSNWLERLPAGSITTWEDLTTRFLAQFFPPGRTAKLRNDILMFQQHHGELNHSMDSFQGTNVPSTSDHRLIELENQVQRLMEAHLAAMQPTQINKIITSCEICSGPDDTYYCMEDPEQAFVEYASSRTDEAEGYCEGLVSKFMASQEARLTLFEADFKQQQSEMTNKIDIVLKAITDRIVGALPSDTVKNPKLSTSPVLSARSYPNMDP